MPWGRAVSYVRAPRWVTFYQTPTGERPEREHRLRTLGGLHPEPCPSQDRTGSPVTYPHIFFLYLSANFRRTSKYEFLPTAPGFETAHLGGGLSPSTAGLREQAVSHLCQGCGAAPPQCTAGAPHTPSWRCPRLRSVGPDGRQVRGCRRSSHGGHSHWTAPQLCCSMDARASP